MKIIAVMPIKLKNERCPGKNIRLLGSKPLLRYELDNLKATGMVEEINVFCSDEAVAAYLPEGISFIKRPADLDLPTSNFTQIFDRFMSLRDADVYVYIHATAPFITVNTMKECIKAVVAGQHDSAFCAVRIQDYLWQGGKPVNFDAANIPRSQDLKPVFRETSGIYVFTKEMYRKCHRRVGFNPYIKEVSYKEAVDINTPEDFRLAEALADIEL